MNKKGFFEESEVLASGLPVIYDIEDGEPEYLMEWFTYTDLKKIFKIYLTEDERKHSIQAFEKLKSGHGFVALYSFVKIMNGREG